eukprot:snap_masked-scaffold_44-processed-gene-0.37-mRNA-1 protein AED:1.00 eAED:1.00 QI:0/0/0/0/1/1/2/0/108
MHRIEIFERSTINTYKLISTKDEIWSTKIEEGESKRWTDDIETYIGKIETGYSDNTWAEKGCEDEIIIPKKGETSNFNPFQFDNAPTCGIFSADKNHRLQVPLRKLPN